VILSDHPPPCQTIGRFFIPTLELFGPPSTHVCMKLGNMGQMRYTPTLNQRVVASTHLHRIDPPVRPPSANLTPSYWKRTGNSGEMMGTPRNGRAKPDLPHSIEPQSEKLRPKNHPYPFTPVGGGQRKGTKIAKALLVRRLCDLPFFALFSILRLSLHRFVPEPHSTTLQPP